MLLDGYSVLYFFFYINLLYFSRYTNQGVYAFVVRLHKNEYTQKKIFLGYLMSL